MRDFVLTVDVEPDERTPPPGAPVTWNGLPLAIERLTAFRRRHPGARFSWFVRVDPQIELLHGDATWALQRYAAELRALEAEGDAIGLHVHPFRWHGGEWVSDYGDADWVRHCIEVAVEGFARTRGTRPRLFRFGDRWMSDDAMAHLERLGITMDLSLEPGSFPAPGMVPAERARGTLPDLRGVPRHRYQPSRRNYRRPPLFAAPRKIRELPVTTARVYPSRFLRRTDFIPLNLGLRPDWIRRVLATTAPPLVSVTRAGDLANAEARAAFEENLAQLGTGGWRFVTPG